MKNEKNRRLKAGVRRVVRADDTRQQVHWDHRSLDAPQIGSREQVSIVHQTAASLGTQSSFSPSFASAHWEVSKALHVSVSRTVDHSFTGKPSSFQDIWCQSISMTLAGNRSSTPLFLPQDLEGFQPPSPHNLPSICFILWFYLKIFKRKPHILNNFCQITNI